ALVAGGFSGLLGIGGGPIKVPVMYLFMGVPLRVATATSNFMIGVTAATSAYIYYARGDIKVPVVAPVVVGVFMGSLLGARLAPRVRVTYILFLLIAVTLYLSVQLVLRLVLRGGGPPCRSDASPGRLRVTGADSCRVAAERRVAGRGSGNSRWPAAVVVHAADADSGCAGDVCS